MKTFSSCHNKLQQEINFKALKILQLNLTEHNAHSDTGTAECLSGFTLYELFPD